MKHVFILNPAAGQCTAQKDYEEQIKICAEKLGCDYEIYFTKGVGDATDFVKNYDQKGECCRYYSIGGDGTLNEVVHGAVGKENCEVAAIPAGTGNDFIRSFSHHVYFSDIERQMRGHADSVDVIEYDGGHAINMVNIGYDCRVVERTAILKKQPFIAGSFAYIAGLVIELARKMGDEIELIFDGDKKVGGTYLLCSVANGCYCGGGFYSSPLAKLNNGMLDVNLIKKVSRLEFLSMVGEYKTGHLYDSEKTKGVYEYYRCNSVTIKQKTRPLFCIDGELCHKDELTFRALKNALRFSIPEGCQKTHMVSEKAEEFQTV